MRVQRHHLLLGGLLLFFAGVLFRLVESFTLSEKSSRLLVAQHGSKGTAQQQSLFGGATPAGPRTIQPPAWLGLALMSVGSVITLKSLSMKG